MTKDEAAALGLTPREVEVLYLIAAGSTGAEIAAALFLSVNSVKTHTLHVYRKIGVDTRLQAAVWVWNRTVELVRSDTCRRCAMGDRDEELRASCGADV